MIDSGGFRVTGVGVLGAIALVLASPVAVAAPRNDAAGSEVAVTTLLPFDKSGGKHTQVDELVVPVGGQLRLGGYPEERIYYVLGGRGALSVYDTIGKGDLYVVRPDISFYFTPGLKHQFVNTGKDALRLIVFRVTGGVVPTQSADGVASWPAVSKPGVTVASPAVGTGFWATYVFDEHSNASVMEGQHLNVHALRLRRAQRITTAELLTVGAHSETRPHKHEDSDETFYVLSGTGDLRWNGRPIPLKAGSVVSVPVAGVRNVENNGDTPLQYIVLNTLVGATP